MTVAQRLSEIRARVAESAAMAGRQSDDVRLIAVSKGQPIDKVRAAHDAGMTDFGENTAQGLKEKSEAFARDGRTARWHFIGRMQRNKLNAILQHASWIHSIDRPELVEAVAKRAPADGVDVLIQVNIGEESQKGGVAGEELADLCTSVHDARGLRLRGFMAVPPAASPPAPYFQKLGEMAHELRQDARFELARELSMGMSHDFEAAIAHGSTMVRVGTGIFGSRETPN